MNRKFYMTILALVDALIINISLILAYLLRFGGDIPAIYFDSYKKIVIYITVVKIIILYFNGIYRNVWKYAGFRDVFNLALITAFGNVAGIAAVYILKGPFLSEYMLIVPRSVYILSWAFDTLMLSATRLLYHFSGNIRFKGILHNSDRKRCLIVGAGSAGSMIIKELRSHGALTRNPVAIVDDDPLKQGLIIDGVPVIGDSSSIPSIVEEKNIDEIIFAIPRLDFAGRKKIIDMCGKTKMNVKVLSGVFELIDGKVSVTKLSPIDIGDLLGREAVDLDIDAVSSYLKKTTVLVTGGGGSIGSELCRQIAGYRPKRLIVLDIYENNAYDIQNELKRKYPSLDLKVVILSVTDREEIFRLFDNYRPDIVFHAAAHKHVPLMEDNPVEAIKNNVFGTLNVIEAAAAYNVKRFVQISTDKAVNPTNVMGASKRICEMILQAYKNVSATKFAAVRFGNVLESNGSVIPLFKKQISRGGPVTVTHPEIIRYFMTITEAVQLVIQAGSMAEGGEIFVLDMGEPVRIDKLARDLIELSGLRPDIDIGIEYVGLRPGEKLYEELLMEEEGLKDTAHEKIFIANPMEIEMSELENKLDILEQGVADNKIILAIEKVVSTYKRDALKHGE